MHLLPRLVLGLLVALPLQGLAQTADAPVASPETSTAPPLLTAPPESETPPVQGELIPRQMREKRSDLFVPRILVGTVLGTVAGAGAGLLGFVGASELSRCNVFDDVCSDEEFFLIAAPTMLLTATASSLTVYGMGNLLRGRGAFLSTWLGGLVGTTVGLILSTFGGYAGVLLMPPLAAIGAVIGYERSHSSRESEPEPVLNAGSSVQMIPVFSVMPGGGVLGGLTGRF